MHKFLQLRSVVQKPVSTEASSVGMKSNELPGLLAFLD
jgi:hypothetical protein